MEISKGNWHYKWFELVYRREPRSRDLCQYMRALLLSPLVVVGWLVLGVWMIVSLPLYYPTKWAQKGYEWDSDFESFSRASEYEDFWAMHGLASIVAFFVYMGLLLLLTPMVTLIVATDLETGDVVGLYITLFFGVIISLASAIGYGVGWYRLMFKPTRRKSREKKGVSIWRLLGMWVVGLKHRFCPTIEFIDEN